MPLNTDVRKEVCAGRVMVCLEVIHACVCVCKTKGDRGKDLQMYMRETKRVGKRKGKRKGTNVFMWEPERKPGSMVYS